MYTVDFSALAALLDDGDAASDMETMVRNHRPVTFAEAIGLARFHQPHEALTAISTGGVIDWDLFDISDFARFMPSMGTLDLTPVPSGDPDFTYRFVGESINAMARRNLRGVRLRDILASRTRDTIITEYVRTLQSGTPRASAGIVDISDLTWMRYLRFLYPVRTRSGQNRILLFMLFSGPKD